MPYARGFRFEVPHKEVGILIEAVDFRLDGEVEDCGEVEGILHFRESALEASYD